MMNKTKFIEQKYQQHLEKIEASKRKRKLKNQKATQADKEKARNRASYDWVRYQFEERVKAQDPDDWLTHDPIWNPKHPLHSAVNALIDKGVPAPDAIKQAEESEITVIPAYVATEKQANFVSNLLDEREAPEGYKVVNANDFADVVYKGRTKPARLVVKDDKVLGKRDASELIDSLLKAPRKQVESSDSDATVDGLDLSDLPAGMYAVPNGDTRLKIRVEHGKPNTRWEGWTFVKDGAAYGNHNRYGMQKPNQPYRGQIEDELREILENPQAAIAAYGELTGKCSACNRKLEDETSVKLGIGPICRNKSTLF